MKYNDQQVNAPDQLVKFVQGEKPGKTATLEVMRSGKTEKIQVTLGERPMQQPFEGNVRPPSSRAPFPMRPEDYESAWESFDSLTLTRLEGNRFKAEVAYRDDKGKTERRKYEGTRQEIREAIEKEKDLPPLERDQLLRALNPRQPSFPFGPPFGPRGGIQ
jgi:hypothetical protein